MSEDDGQEARIRRALLDEAESALEHVGWLRSTPKPRDNHGIAALLAAAAQAFVAANSAAAPIRWPPENP